MGRLYSLQMLRGVAALLVVFVHLEDVELKRGGQLILGEWADSGAAGVDIFFALSGFVMFLVTHEIRGGVGNVFQFVWKRAARIYPLWWACMAVITILWLLRPDLVYANSSNNVNLLKDFFLIYDGRSPLLEVGWTLIHELYFYMIVAFLLLLWNRIWFRVLVISIWTFSAIILNFIFGIEEEGFLHIVTHPMTLEFSLGFVAAWLFVSNVRINFVVLLVIGSLLFFAALCMSALQLEGASIIGDSSKLTDWQRSLFFGPSSACVILALAGLERSSQFTTSFIFSKLGDWSFALYLTHMFTLNACGLVWDKFNFTGVLDNAFFILLSVLLSVLVSAVVFEFYEKRIYKYLSFIGMKVAHVWYKKV